MEVIGVIPARLHSTRLEEKLLRQLSGRTVLEWTWQSAKKASKLDDLIIAVDDKKIAETAEGFGAKVVFTSSQHTSGTDRICEAVSSVEARVVINIQADEPLMHPSVINSLAELMSEDRQLCMATAVVKTNCKAEVEDPNVVKAVITRNNFALYFSRAVLPFAREKDISPDYYKHLGIYAYTKDFLYVFKNLPVSRLEEIERLEQLRVLEAGFQIKTVITQFDSWGIDTQQDLEKVEAVLSQKGQS
jgi:3-deoxy-manno-octulosonate cytidylyltransferase (CMP-KDO synthetase)